MSDSTPRRASFRDLSGLGEFRALWASMVLSAGGDRLALVAITLLIFDKTRSPLLAAVAFASGTLPYITGALFLSGLADRYPRRAVMVAADAVRLVLVGVMLIPGMPLAALITLLYGVTAVQPAFDAARSAVIRDIVSRDAYPLAAGALQSTARLMLVAGAALGGLVVAAAGARGALAADAATFALSGVIVGCGLRRRPAAAAGPPGRPGALAGMAAGARLVFGDRALRLLMLLGWLAACYEVPEGLAVPYAGALGGGPVAAGLLIAFSQLGLVVAMPLFTKRVSVNAQQRLMGPLAAGACAVLLVAVLRPSLAVSMATFAVSSMFTVYQVAANAAFVERLPGERRAQAFGLANAGLVVGQGIVFAIAGALAEVMSPSAVVALAGGLGAVLALGLSVSWRRITPSADRRASRRPRPSGARPGSRAWWAGAGPGDDRGVAG